MTSLSPNLTSNRYIPSYNNTIQLFAIKDLGNINYFLGIEVVNYASALFLTQQKYIREVLNRTHFDGTKPTLTPANTQLMKGFLK